MPDFDVLATGYQLIEGPTVLPDGGLAFSDVLGGGVHRLHPGGEVTTLVPKRRGVGGIALHADGGIVCTGRDVIHVRDGVTIPVFDDEGAAWNDLAVDGQGRVWAGSVRFAVFDPDAEHTPGELWRIDATGGTPVVDGIHHCNGVGFSPAGDRVHVSDTRRDVVVSTDLDGGDRREIPVPTPDGLSVDSEGRLWVASFGERQVRCIDPDGLTVQTIDVGAPTTSVCLTPDGTLYVVTAAHAGRGGSVLRTHVDAAGLPLTPASV